MRNVAISVLFWVLAGIVRAGAADAQSEICVESPEASSRHDACISAGVEGAHIRETSTTSPLLDITVGGHKALSIDSVGVKFAEPGATVPTDFSPLITLNETNLATNKKHGIYGLLYTDNAGSPINVNLLSLDIFTPPDNGGDVSGAYIRQTGGGNAISAFNLCGERPKGFTAYCGQGFAIEAQVDGAKSSVFASAENGDALLATVKGASGTGLAIFPSPTTAPHARAIHVATPDNSRETFYVDMSGQVFAQSHLFVEGGIQAHNQNPQAPVFQAGVNAQAGFAANTQNRDAVAFLARPAQETTTGGAALQVQNANGDDIAHVNMDGSAAFRTLIVDRGSVKPTLQGTSALLGGTRLANGRCAQTSVRVQGATPAMAVTVSPAGGVDPGDGFFVRGLTFDRDTIVVKVCNATGAAAIPAATTYNVRVIP